MQQSYSSYFFTITAVRFLEGQKKKAERWGGQEKDNFGGGTKEKATLWSVGAKDIFGRWGAKEKDTQFLETENFLANPNSNVLKDRKTRKYQKLRILTFYIHGNKIFGLI